VQPEFLVKHETSLVDAAGFEKLTPATVASVVQDVAVCFPPDSFEGSWASLVLQDAFPELAGLPMDTAMALLGLLHFRVFAAGGSDLGSLGR
jgi:hypothetical protein